MRTIPFLTFVVGCAASHVTVVPDASTDAPPVLSDASVDTEANAPNDGAPPADAVTSDAPLDAFTGPIDCVGFSSTRVLAMDWNAPQTLTTASVGGAGPDDAIVVVFTTGNGTMPNAYGNVTGAEYASSPSSRIASLSTIPCDFASSLGAGATSKSNTVTVDFSVGANTSAFYPALAAGTTYYLNVEEAPLSTCMSDGNCDMYFQLHKPPGL